MYERLSRCQKRATTNRSVIPEVVIGNPVFAVFERLWVPDNDFGNDDSSTLPLELGKWLRLPALNRPMPKVPDVPQWTTDSSTSSGISKFAWTFCTSSCSSN